MTAPATIFLTLTLLAGLPAIGAAIEEPPTCGTPLPPARMTYQLYDDKKQRGQGVAVLAPENDGTWRFRMDSTARAGILRGTSVEQTQFTWDGDMPRPLAYERRFQVGPLRRVSTADFDWQADAASGKHRGRSWTLAVAPGDVDRLLLQIASARLLAADAESIALRYLDRGRYRELVDPVLEAELIETEGGNRWQTRRVDRTSGSRTTSTWHAEALAFLPVRIEHDDEDDDELLRLDLVTVEWLPCPDG
ncbi:MAG: DUF3108 domain-containing protein [Pseudomonadota bacterium]